MAIRTKAVSVGDNSAATAASAAFLTATGVADLDFRSTAGARTGTGATSTDFSSGKTVVIVFAIDGGSNQTVTLNTNLTNTAGVVAALQAGTTGGTWTSGSNILTLTSSTTGPSSSVNVVSETDSGISSLNMAVGSTSGSNAQNYTATIEIDRGAPFSFSLTALYANAAALQTALNTATPGAVWTNSTGTFTVTSSTTGANSSITYTAPVAPAKDVKIASAGSTGVAANYALTLLYNGAIGGSSNLPVQVQVYNNSADILYLVSPDATSVSSGMPIKTGANEVIPCETGEQVWALADTGKTIDARVLTTRS